MENNKKKLKFEIKGEIKCLNCLKNQEDSDLYFCKYHKKVFCRNCLTPSRAPKFNEAIHCNRKYLLGDFFNTRYYNPNDDCIYLLIPKKDVPGSIKGDGKASDSEEKGNSFQDNK